MPPKRETSATEVPFNPSNYRFGDNGKPAWQAIQQTFGALLLNSTGVRLDGEFVLVQLLQQPAAFIDLVNGTVVPFSSVAYALPV